MWGKPVDGIRDPEVRGPPDVDTLVGFQCPSLTAGAAAESSTGEPDPRDTEYIQSYHFVASKRVSPGRLLIGQ